MILLPGWNCQRLPFSSTVTGWLPTDLLLGPFTRYSRDSLSVIENKCGFIIEVSMLEFTAAGLLLGSFAGSFTLGFNETIRVELAIYFREFSLGKMPLRRCCKKVTAEIDCLGFISRDLRVSIYCWGFIQSCQSAKKNDIEIRVFRRFRVPLPVLASLSHHLY